MPDPLPFDHEAHCEPHTSLALKANDRVIGWTISHRVGGVLRYTCSFMHPRWQRRGHILLLYNVTGNPPAYLSIAGRYATATEADWRRRVPSTVAG